MRQFRNQPRTCRRAAGFTLTEVVVSASLLVVVMGFVTPLAIRGGRMWQDTRRQQLAADELFNQIELLSTLSPQGREQAIEQLSPSEHLKAACPNVQLSAQTISDSDGQRIQLSLSWDTKSKPLILVGWLDSISDAQVSEQEAEE